MKVLIIDPGSTTTKVGVYEGDRIQRRWTIHHERTVVEGFERIAEQEEMRFQSVRDRLVEEGLWDGPFDAVAGRGGLLKPLGGGTYEVGEAMVADLRARVAGEHASNLGAVLAARFAGRFGAPAYVVDPVVVDELEPLARLSGLKGIERRSIFHALNQRSVARGAAARIGKVYGEVSLIVAHLGGGISVGAHRRGRVIDVNNALDGDGPYAPERAGGLPVGGVLEFLEREGVGAEELRKRISRSGGLCSYLGEVDLRRIESRIDGGDGEAKLVLEGMAYQVAKEIGALAAVLEGEVDGIVLTGGAAFSKYLTDEITRRVGFIASVFLEPGERELEALGEGVMRVLRGEEEAGVYT